jgi:hypothetical protein
MTKQAAALVAQSADATKYIEAISMYVEGHFDTDPDDANWSDVEDAKRIVAMLKQINDIVTKSGEYAISY